MPKVGPPGLEDQQYLPPTGWFQAAKLVAAVSFAVFTALASLPRLVLSLMEHEFKSALFFLVVLLGGLAGSYKIFRFLGDHSNVLAATLGALVGTLLVFTMGYQSLDVLSVRPAPAPSAPGEPPPLKPPEAGVARPPLKPPEADVARPPLKPPEASVARPPLKPPEASVARPPLKPPEAGVARPPLKPPEADVARPPLKPPEASVA